MPYAKSARNPTERETTEQMGTATPGRVTACVDTSAAARKVVAHAWAIAHALNAELTVVRVLQPAEGRMPPDPVEWEIRRREAWDSMGRIVEEHDNGAGAIKAQVIEGHAAEQICLWAGENNVDLTVFASHGSGAAAGRHPGATARGLIDAATASFLLVPRSVENDQDVHFRKILVPLDGSSRAESVLPLAVRVSQAEGGEIVLVHIVPSPEMTEIGPMEEEALELRGRLTGRNERIARDYLDRVRGRLIRQGVAVRTLILRDGNVSRRLARAIAEEAADLVVLSAHGRAGHADVPHGSVAAYQLAYASAPLLVVSHQSARSPRYNMSSWASSELRLPEQASV